MKSEKGVSLVSLIIYLIAMTIAVGIVARISNYFYRNINILDTSLTSSEEFLNFNAYITKEVNIKLWKNEIFDFFKNRKSIWFYKQ